jgi:hypothetical protein
MDDLTPEQRKRELDRITYQERKRQYKIENFEKLSPEKAKFLKERKSRLVKFNEWRKHIGEDKPIEPLKVDSKTKHLRELARRELDPEYDSFIRQKNAEMQVEIDKFYNKQEGQEDNILSEEQSQSVIEQLKYAEKKRNYESEDIDYTNEELPQEETE